MDKTPFEYPSKEAFAEMLKTLRHGDIVTKYLLAGETPFAFRDKRKGYDFLIGTIAKSLTLNVDAVTLVGSARIGFSLSPFKFGAPFSNRSDLDFAIVNAALFDKAWLELVGLGTRFARLDREVQQWVNEHRTNNVYWGYMEPENLRNAVSCYREWFPLFAGLAQYTSFAEGGVSGRLYRSWDHVRSHQLYSLAKIRRTLA